MHGLRRIKFTLAAIGLFCLDPLLLFLYPQAGTLDNKDSLQAALFVSGTVLFPALGVAVLWAALPRANRRWIMYPLGALLVVLGIGSSALFMKEYSRLSRDATAKLKAFEAAYAEEKDRIIQKARSATEVVWSDSTKFDRPYIILWRGSESDRTVDRWWFRTIFGEEVFRALITFGRPFDDRPPFECATAFLVEYHSERTGRMIQLDRGSVPEYRWYAEVYAVELRTRHMMKLPGKVYGSKAKKPGTRLGTGIIEVSYLEGNKPSESRVKELIYPFLNH